MLSICSYNFSYNPHTAPTSKILNTSVCYYTLSVEDVYFLFVGVLVCPFGLVCFFKGEGIALFSRKHLATN